MLIFCRRWVNGLMAIWAGVILVITACLVPETYPPVLHVHLVIVKNDIGDGEQDANRDGYEWKTADTLVPATTLAIDNWECAEKHVKNTVDDGVIE